MPTCPIGHDSDTDDYCGVCGRLMPGEQQARPASFPPPSGLPFPSSGGPEPLGPGLATTAAAELCPRCKTPREGAEPYCEGCRWHFASGSEGQQPSQQTGSLSLPKEAPQLQPPASPSWTAPAPPPAAMPPAPAFPKAPEPPDVSNRQPPGFSGTDFLIAEPEPSRRQGSGSHAQPPAAASWYVTVVADREYFTAMMARSGPEAQNLFFPPYCPERRFELSGNQLRIGRTRHRAGEEAPDIDLAKPPEDPGVSHKHAVLVQGPDGSWAIVDQDSTNGTTVNGADDPVSAFVPVQLKDGDRVHVGAWTTITLHRL